MDRAYLSERTFRNSSFLWSSSIFNESICDMPILQNCNIKQEIPYYGVPSTISNQTQYGNLHAYKLYIRPTARRLYGSSHYRKKSTIKHHEEAQKLLEVLAKNGAITTWDMAKIRFPSDVSKLRDREKKYRRLLMGRTDRGKHSEGILELGLVLKDGKSYKKAPADKYRLSLHGILYCLDVFSLDQKNIDIIADNYSKVLPKVFGKWDFLKSIIGDEIYSIRLLASGLLGDNPLILVTKGVPFYELMSYLHIKYHRNFENISEEDLANQISYWFYTNLLYQPLTKSKKNTVNSGLQKLQPIFEKDKKLNDWFYEFFNEAQQYYKTRFQILKNAHRKEK